MEYIPEVCVWELTLQCNMHCIHCGSMAGKARENELTVDECLDTADELLKLGCRQVTFIGGEIFLYKGWEKIARRLVDGGALVNIITNGFIMGQAQVEQTRYARLSNVGFSIDGMEENHNRIRNVDTSFQKIKKALALLRQEGIPTAAVTSLLDFNVDDLPQLFEFLVESGVTVWQLQVAAAMGNMAEQKGLLLKPEKIPLITKFIREKRNEQEMRIYAGDNIGYFDENEMYLRNRPGTISAWHGCKAGLRVVGIDSIGNVKGCESLYSDYFIEGNLREESLEEIWCKEGNFSYNRQFDVSQLTGRCSGCDKAQICRGGCRGACYFSTDMLYENPYCCYPGSKQEIDTLPHPSWRLENVYLTY
jgi:radical SAM protein with 4Fe4S-binding SPASM domain